MSSGEVLFILAFIVLPTAVLVSSVWAILFVRRRPERVVEYPEVRASSADLDASGRYDVVDTLVLPTVGRAGITRAAEPTVDDSGTSPQETPVQDVSQTDDTPVLQPAASELPSEDTSAKRIDALNETKYQDSTDIAIEEDSDYLQSTDDLNAIVAEVAANDTHDAHSPSLTNEDDTVEEDDADMYETSDLPVLEPPDGPAGERRAGVDRPPESEVRVSAETPEAAQPESESRWRRRKRPTPLRSNDPEAGRARSRGRDPQRQVPQLGRSSRKRDGDTSDTDVDDNDAP